MPTLVHRARVQTEIRVLLNHYMFSCGFGRQVLNHPMVQAFVFTQRACGAAVLPSCLRL